MTRITDERPAMAPTLITGPIHRETEGPSESTATAIGAGTLSRV